MIFVKCCKNFFRFFFSASSDSPSVGVCYNWDFTEDDSGSIDSFTYDSGSQVVVCNIALNQTEAQIKAQLEATIGSIATYTSITVLKTFNAPQNYDYAITIKNPSIDITILSETGNDRIVTITDC